MRLRRTFGAISVALLASATLSIQPASADVDPDVFPAIAFFSVSLDQPDHSPLSCKLSAATPVPGEDDGPPAGPYYLTATATGQCDSSSTGILVEASVQYVQPGVPRQVVCTPNSKTGNIVVTVQSTCRVTASGAYASGGFAQFSFPAPVVDTTLPAGCKMWGKSAVRCSVFSPTVSAGYVPLPQS